MNLFDNVISGLVAKGEAIVVGNTPAQPVTDWGASPSFARWYGEVVVGRNVDGGTETDYHYGYSNDEDPNVHDLVPEGWDLLEETLNEIKPPGTKGWLDE